MTSDSDTCATANQDASPTIHCPFCGSTETEEMGVFGSQLSTAQRYCRSCHTPFERLTRVAGQAQSPSGERASEQLAPEGHAATLSACADPGSDG